MRHYCYLSGVLITEENKSLEHIIPNALNGHLTSNYVLTKESNNKLGDLIDKEFDKTFEIFTSQFEFKRDRGRNPNFLITDAETNEKYVLSSTKISPLKPYYSERESAIYAKDKKKYKQTLKNLDVKDVDKIKLLDDRTGMYTYLFNLDNKVFKLGMAKIAAGFATLNGVTREDLNMILNLESNCFNDKLPVMPFIPLNMVEYNIEKSIHDSYFYPFHALTIHGNKENKFLYAYVELYSTFQYVIILNDNYSGEDMYKDYFYSLSKECLFTFNEYKEKIQAKELNSMFYRNIDLKYLDKIMFTVNVRYDLFKEYGHMKFNHLMRYGNKKMHYKKFEISI